jgi:hypothetical protein
MIRTQPVASFIVVAADFAFNFFENNFIMPAYNDNTHQVMKVNIYRDIAKVEAQHCTEYMSLLLLNAAIPDSP